MKRLIVAVFVACGVARAESTPTDTTPEAKDGGEKKTQIVRIYEPVQPKSVGVLPSGWTLAILKDRKIQAAPVALPTGKSAKITALAFVVVPDEQKGSILVADPGYDPKKGLRQTDTIGAVLTAYIEESEKLSRSLEAASQQLRSELDAASPSPSPAGPSATRKKGS